MPGESLRSSCTGQSRRSVPGVVRSPRVSCAGGTSPLLTPNLSAPLDPGVWIKFRSHVSGWDTRGSGRKIPTENPTPTPELTGEEGVSGVRPRAPPLPPLDCRPTDKTKHSKIFLVKAATSAAVNPGRATPRQTADSSQALSQGLPPGRRSRVLSPLSRVLFRSDYQRAVRRLLSLPASLSPTPGDPVPGLGGRGERYRESVGGRSRPSGPGVGATTEERDTRTGHFKGGSETLVIRGSRTPPRVGEVGT